MTNTDDGNNNNINRVECVGSLLVHASDLQELSVATKTAASPIQTVNLKKRTTAGTLLINSEDLATPKSNKGPDAAHDTDASPGLVRRVTERLSGPAAPRDETDWTED